MSWDLVWNPLKVTESHSIGRKGREGRGRQGMERMWVSGGAPRAHKRRDRKSTLRKEKGFPTIQMLARKA